MVGSCFRCGAPVDSTLTRCTYCKGALPPSPELDVEKLVGRSLVSGHHAINWREVYCEPAAREEVESFLWAYTLRVRRTIRYLVLAAGTAAAVYGWRLS